MIRVVFSDAFLTECVLLIYRQVGKMILGFEPEMLWRIRQHGCNICLEGLRKPGKILKVDISNKGPHAGEPVYVFEMYLYIAKRDLSGMAAWLGALKEGAQEGEEKKFI
jgi:hypothetical protein